MLKESLFKVYLKTPLYPKYPQISTQESKSSKEHSINRQPSGARAPNY